MTAQSRTYTPLKEAIRGWGTQTKLARRLRVPDSTVSRWANGLLPPPRKRQQIARVLGEEETTLWPSN